MTGLRDDFIWGAATSSHQIEGGNTNNDFWAMEHSGAPHVTEPSGDACDSYHRYRDDIRLLAEGGLKAYRFSLEWSRIEPAEGEISRAQLGHYRAMIDTCHEFGVLPMVTLHHFTNPLWLAAKGGFGAPDVVERFRFYVEAACEILHDVEWVVTINEPNMDALFGALTQQAASATSEATDAGGAAFATAKLTGPSDEIAETLVAMHRAAVEVLRARTQAKVGWGIAAQAFMPTPGNEAVWERVFHQWEGVFCDGAVSDQGVPDDFLAVQSYTSQTVDANGPVPHPDHPDNTLTGWAYRPDALGINLRRYWDRYHIPLLVTENGIATADDQRRIEYVTAALRGMKDAVADGVDVRGYCYWSLLDNYEWGSFTPTFGLIAVDRAGDFSRTPKPSLAWLGRVAASNAADI